MWTSQASSRRVLVLAAFAAAAGLGGCTHSVDATLSRAVVDARAHRDVTHTAACPALSSPVSVGFAFSESSLNELAAPALESAGLQLTCHPQVSALIVGQSDGHGTDAEQRQLAQTRAEAVAQDLRGRGIVAGRLQTQVQGTAPEGDAGRLIVLAEGRRW
ncbi:MAG: OmpA family [Phenylobacterium sp.]|nr:OmpA family [Phenylobacterium sp.]